MPSASLIRNGKPGLASLMFAYIFLTKSRVPVLPGPVWHRCNLYNIALIRSRVLEPVSRHICMCLRLQSMYAFGAAILTAQWYNQHVHCKDCLDTTRTCRAYQLNTGVHNCVLCSCLTVIQRVQAPSIKECGETGRRCPCPPEPHLISLRLAPSAFQDMGMQ